MATKKYRRTKTRRLRKTRKTRRLRKGGMFPRIGKSVARHSGDVLKEIVIGEAQTKWKGQDTLIDKYDKLQHSTKPNLYNIYDKENTQVKNLPVKQIYMPNKTYDLEI